jgi:membrane protease YdiL (CAAX protease family)
MLILVELLALILFLLLSRKDLTEVFRLSKDSLIKGLFLGLFYVSCIFITKHTQFGSSVINQFIAGIKLSSFVLYIIYPFVIALSEEFIFRYFISQKIGWLSAAVIFTILHWRTTFPVALFLPVFLFALSQSWLFKKVKTLVPLILTHLMVTYSLLFI